MRKVITAVIIGWLTLAGGVASASDHVDHLTPRQQWCDSVGIPASNDDGTTTSACRRAHSQCRPDSPSATQMNWASKGDAPVYHDGKAWVPCPTPSEEDAGDDAGDDAGEDSGDDASDGS